MFGKPCCLRVGNFCVQMDVCYACLLSLLCVSSEAPESPIDVQGILKRAAATVDDGRQPSASGKGGISQNGAKGNPEAAAAATAAAGKPAEGSSGTAEGSSDPAAAAPETAAPEATAKASNGAVSKDQDTAEASKPEAATLEKDSAAGGSDEKGPAGADPEAASKPAEGASKPSYAALAATPVEQQEEEPVEEKAAPEPSASSSGPAVATASATRYKPLTVAPQQSPWSQTSRILQDHSCLNCQCFTGGSGTVTMQIASKVWMLMRTALMSAGRCQGATRTILELQPRPTAPQLRAATARQGRPPSGRLQCPRCQSGSGRAVPCRRCLPGPHVSTVCLLLGCM